MSKMDAMRAMREARYAATKQPSAGAARPKVKPPTPEPVAKEASVPETSAEELCGHRAISGRTCTREKGHAAKSHRYS